MRRTAGAGAALGVALLLALSGCSGPGEDELIAQAKAEFDALVEDAAAVELDVLHTLEVEDPVSTSCDEESDAEHTVFVAAGTMAVQSTPGDEAGLIKLLKPEPPVDDEAEGWTEIDGLPSGERAYLSPEGITVAVSARQGLLVITVFSPCR